MKDSLAISQKLSPRKYALLAGTLLLTSTGLITRVLGFFYRIFLSRTIGAEGMGIYSMVYPVFGVCISLCATSIQTAISQSVAANVRKGRSIFRTGLFISVSISLVLAYGIYTFKDFLASSVLMEPRCASLLIFIAVAVPCTAVHACINGYYYGMQRAKVPAFAQVVEQTARIGAVFLIADIMMESGIEITVQLAAFGHLIGEAISSLFTIAAYQFFPPKAHDLTVVQEVAPRGLSAITASFTSTAPVLMTLALPLMGNRLVLNVLGSIEAIWIPNRLQLSGLSDSMAFSLYGVLTGMALPFIHFPSTIFHSMAVLLLPTVAEAQSDGNEGRISNTISTTLRYCMYIGVLCIGIFTLFGNELGVSVFRDKNAGTYITILAWLCPFIYLVTTMGSILNGLGKTSVTFGHNVVATLVRLGFVFFGIPRFGIMAYLIGMLISELLLAFMHVMALRKRVDFTWSAWDMIVKPAVLMILSIGIYYAILSVWDPFDGLHLFIGTAIHIMILCVCYLALLAFCHVVRGEKEE